MIYRDARRADLPALVDLLADDVIGRERERPGEPLHADYLVAFEAIEHSPDNALIVAEDKDGTIVGMYQLTVTPGLSNRGALQATIEGVRVASRLRGGGIGAALVGDAVRRARDAGCRSVQLTTSKIRVDAQRFYARLGFRNSHEGMKLDLDLDRE